MATDPQSARQPRNTWMDATRGLAVLLVVASHAYGVLLTTGQDGSSVMRYLNLALGPHRMPLLMFMSGMLLSRSLAKGGRRFFSGKLRGIGWPYLVWTTLTLITAHDFTVEKWVRNLYSPTTPLWYLWFILANYLVSYVLLRCRVPATLTAVMSLVAAGLVTNAYAGDRLLFFFGFFMLGHAVMSHWSTASSFLRRPWVPVIGAATAVAVSGLAVAGIEVRFDARWSWGPLGLVALVLAVAPGLDAARSSRALRYVGRHSLVFYCTHWPVMLLTAALLMALDRAEGALLYWSALVAALAAGALLARALNRSRCVNAFFTFPLPAALGRSSRLARSRTS